jgi:hypothetical protein
VAARRYGSWRAGLGRKDDPSVELHMAEVRDKIELRSRRARDLVKLDQHVGPGTSQRAWPAPGHGRLCLHRWPPRVEVGGRRRRRDMLSPVPIWTKELGLVLHAAGSCVSPLVAPAQRNKRVGWSCEFNDLKID